MKTCGRWSRSGPFINCQSDTKIVIIIKKIKILI